MSARAPSVAIELMRRRPLWASLVAGLICLSSCQAGGSREAQATHLPDITGASSQIGASSGPLPQPDGSGSSSAVPEHITGPDYPLARWIPATPSNFTVADRPHDYPVDMIVIHDTEVPVAGAVTIFQDPTRKASANYIVSATGQVTQMVAEKDIAWHAGNWDYNIQALGIENEGYAWIPGTFTRAEYQASARLAASICSRWGVPMDRSHVIGHNQVPDPNHAGQFGGESRRTDPGPYWDWGYYMKLAASYANALPSPPHMMVDPVAINGLDSATVTWRAAQSCHLPILGYTVVGEPGDLTSYLPATATTVTFHNLQPDTRYTFTVTAINVYGQDSLTSNAVIPGHCNNAQLSATPNATQAAGGTVVFYGSSVGCLKPRYAFALLAPWSSVWIVVQPYSSSPVYEWTATYLAPGMYSVRLLVRDADSLGTFIGYVGTYDDHNDIAYTVTPA